MGEHETTIGTIIRDDKGRFAPGTLAPGTITTPAQASALARTRWDRAKEAAAAGLLQGVKDSGVVKLDPRAHPVDAWGTIIAHNTAVIMRSDDSRGLAELTRQVGQAADMIPDNRQAQETPGLTASIHVPIDQLAPLLDALRQERERRECLDVVTETGATETDTTHPPTTTDDDVG